MCGMPAPPHAPPPASPLSRFAPPLVWMAVIALLSSRYFGAGQTESLFVVVAGWLLPGAASERLAILHGVVRKLGHLVEYGVLAILWMRGLAPDRSLRRTAALAFALTVAYAGLDEARQGLTPNRAPSLLDVGIDAGGAGLAAYAWRPRSGRAESLRGLGRLAGLFLLTASLAAAAVAWSFGLTPWELVGAGLGGGLLYRLGWRLGWRAGWRPGRADGPAGQGDGPGGPAGRAGRPGSSSRA